MEQEAREKEKKRQSESSNNLLTGEPSIPIDPSKFYHLFIYKNTKNTEKKSH